MLGAAASPTRGLFNGGRTSDSNGNATIDYITIASTGNAIDFGDMNNTVYQASGCSNSTRALFPGGTATPSFSSLNVIDFVTIATTGNATDFGDLTSARASIASTASATRALFGGPGNVIDFVTIASAGNATDFGDLLFSNVTGENMGAMSTAHGGLS
jgi:hypothetical protein